LRFRNYAACLFDPGVLLLPIRSDRADELKLDSRETPTCGTLQRRSGVKVVICEEPGKLAVIDCPRPEPHPNEVLVHIRRVGICGTDFHIFGGKHPYLEYPRVMGHELSGTVELVPAGCKFSPGQNVYIVPYLSCGHCAACRKDITNACQTIRVLGVHCDGGMAE